MSVAKQVSDRLKAAFYDISEAMRDGRIPADADPHEVAAQIAMWIRGYADEVMQMETPARDSSAEIVNHVHALKGMGWTIRQISQELKNRGAFSRNAPEIAKARVME
jgi:hypothetical protein